MPNSTKGKILIIEDDTVLAKMYAKKFQTSGFEVINAYSGNEGLALAIRDKPNAIILDVMMPGMDGFAVMKHLTEDENARFIPVVMLTNLGDSQVFVDEAKKLGVKDYMVKYKTSAQEVVERVEKIVSNQ